MTFLETKLAAYVRKNTLLSAAVLTCVLSMGSVHGENWPVSNVTVCDANGAQDNPQGVSDGAGGTIIAWIDWRNSSRAIYAQRINQAGVKQWAINGVPVCTPLADQFTTPQIISDGAGGAIIGWTDVRNNTSGIYAQRISHMGEVLWTVNGIVVSPNIGVRYTPKLTSDGAGGAIMVYRGYKDADYNIYAQRVDGSGVRQWGSGDFPIAVTEGYVEECELVTDGHGGAIMSWYDRRNGNYDIYAQRVSHTGARQWALNGIPICTMTRDQSEPRITSDGVDGAIITWADYRSGVAYDIYAQRVNPAGTTLWTADGVPVCTSARTQWLPEIVSDGANGAIIAWEDWRSTANSLYMQRLNSAGMALWAANGVSVAQNLKQETFSISTNSLNGAVAGWKNSATENFDLFVQEVNSQGVGITPPGDLFISETGVEEPAALIADPDGQVIAVWNDSRNGNSDIFAAQLIAPQVRTTVEHWNLYD